MKESKAELLAGLTILGLFLVSLFIAGMFVAPAFTLSTTLFLLIGADMFAGMVVAAILGLAGIFLLHDLLTALYMSLFNKKEKLEMD